MLESRADRSALGAPPDIAVVDVAITFLFTKTELFNHTRKQTNDPCTISASDFVHEACFVLDKRDLEARNRIRIIIIISIRNATHLSVFKFKETPFLFFIYFSQMIIQRVHFEQHTKGVFGTVRTEAYRRYIPPVLPLR